MTTVVSTARAPRVRFVRASVLFVLTDAAVFVACEVESFGGRAAGACVARLFFCGVLTDGPACGIRFAFADKFDERGGARQLFEPLGDAGL